MCLDTVVISWSRVAILQPLVVVFPSLSAVSSLRNPTMSSGEKARAPGGLMDAVSALASLGGPEDEQQHGDLHLDGPVQLFDGDSPGKSSKRYIPDHKKPDAALTFPEKVCFVNMRVCRREEESYRFVIRRKYTSVHVNTMDNLIRY